MRAGKSSIIRPKSIASYADEIEALFNDSLGDTELGALSQEQVQDTVALEVLLGAYVRSILAFLPGGMDGDKEDLFAYGLDSVQTIELASGLRALLHPYLDPTDLSTVAVKVVYAYSTIDNLTKYVSGLLGMATNIEGDMAAKLVARMTAMLEKYTKDLPEAGNGAMVTLWMWIRYPRTSWRISSSTSYIRIMRACRRTNLLSPQSESTG